MVLELMLIIGDFQEHFVVENHVGLNSAPPAHSEDVNVLKKEIEELKKRHR